MTTGTHTRQELVDLAEAKIEMTLFNKDFRMIKMNKFRRHY